jgi:hypothetical protein
MRRKSATFIAQKIIALRLHITGRGVELFDPQPRRDPQFLPEVRFMKLLLVLTAAAAVMASSTGCFHWFNRGGSCQSAPTYSAPACGAPAATYSADPYMGAPAAATIPPGATYVPGPQG